MHNIRKNFEKRILALVLTASMLAGLFSVPVYATETVENATSQVEEVSADDNSSEKPIAAGENAPTDAGTADASAETDEISGEPQAADESGQEKEGDEPETDEAATEEGETAETEAGAFEDVDQLIEAAGFTELSSGTQLDSEQMADKQDLADHTPDLESCVAGKDYAENEIVVMAEDEETALEYADAYNADLVHFEYGLALLELKPQTEELENIGCDADMVAVAVSVSADPDVNLPAAWPNYYDELLDDTYEYDEFESYRPEFNDPLLIADRNRYQWHHETIGSNAAWRAGYKGQGIKVAIIDSGLTTHEDIEVVGAERISRSGNSIVVTYDDTYDNASGGHGTLCTGLIGGQANNNKGGCGVAPLCDMYMYKVVSGTGTTVDTYVEYMAVKKAVKEFHADVINISIGGPNYVGPFQETIKDAYDNGTVVVCAAGNEGVGSMSYPAAYDGAVSVGATNRSNEKAVFSVCNEKVRYGAPGVAVYCPVVGTPAYGENQGTSFASPILAGMVAVVLSSGWVTSEGSQRVEDVLSILDSSCTKTCEGIGKGIPNLAVAFGLDLDDQPPVSPRFNYQTGTYTDESLEIELTTDNHNSPYKDLIFYSDNGGNVSFINGKPSANAKRYNDIDRIIVTGKRTTVIKAIAVNPSNGMASKQVTCTYTLKPFVSGINVTTDTGHFKLRKSSNLLFTAKVTPSFAYNTGVKYEITERPEISEGKKSAYISGNRIYAPANVMPGTYKVVCTAKDGGGADTDFDVVVESPDRKVYSITVPKTSVTLYSGMPEIYKVKLTTIEGKAKYEEPAELYTTWSSSNTSIATVALDGNDLTITPLKAGKVTVKGVSTDGTKVSRSITVNVRTHPTGVKINRFTGHKVAVGKSVKLTASVEPADVYNKSVIWSISAYPPEVDPKNGAKINSSGTFSASKAEPGTYTVRATAKDKNNDGNEVYNDYAITVTPNLTKSITLAKKSTSIFRVKNGYGCPNSDSVLLTLNGGYPSGLSVTSSNASIVTGSVLEASDGKLYLEVKPTAAGTGTAKLTVKANDGSGKSASISVKITNPAAYLEVSVPSGAYTNLVKGKKMKLTAKLGTTFGTLSAAAKKLTWSSSDPKVISVDGSGNVTAKSDTGSATITVKNNDGSNLSSSISISAVKNKSVIETDGMWELTTDSWTYVEELSTGDVAYMTLTNDLGSTMSKNYCDVSVDKPGLSVRWKSVSRSGKPNSSIELKANATGTYTLTVKFRDKSSAVLKKQIVVK